MNKEGHIGSYNTKTKKTKNEYVKIAKQLFYSDKCIQEIENGESVEDYEKALFNERERLLKEDVKELSKNTIKKFSKYK